MSIETYNAAISNAQAWFSEKLRGVPEVTMAAAEVKSVGTDAIAREDIKALLRDCSEFMLAEHRYELSYSQRCRAFFDAARGLDLLRLA